jgi:hypothetical protein
LSGDALWVTRPRGSESGVRIARNRPSQYDN